MKTNSVATALDGSSSLREADNFLWDRINATILLEPEMIKCHLTIINISAFMLDHTGRSWLTLSGLDEWRSSIVFVLYQHSLFFFFFFQVCAPIGWSRLRDPKLKASWGYTVSWRTAQPMNLSWEEVRNEKGKERVWGGWAKAVSCQIISNEYCVKLKNLERKYTYQWKWLYVRCF